MADVRNVFELGNVDLRAGRNVREPDSLVAAGRYYAASISSINSDHHLLTARRGWPGNRSELAHSSEAAKLFCQFAAAPVR